jgi:LCP family protein required for cell wall assembly
MRRPALLGAGLTLMLAACGLTAKSEVGASRLAKGASAPDPSTPAVTLIAVTPPPTPQPRALGHTPWPAPFTYGSGTPPPTAIPPPVEPFAFPGDTINIALLGSDRRPNSSAFRTDVVLVLSIQPSAGGAALISIPRDLYVYLPGYTMFRVNQAWLFGETLGSPGGGPGMLRDTLLYNLGIPIDHYAVVEMSGFSGLIDSVEGVDVTVACSYTDWRLRRPNLDQNVEANWALYTVPQGTVHMDGDYALWYARSRARSSDFDRSRRQHEVLRAFYRKFLSLGMLPRLPQVYDELRGLVVTDLGVGDLIRLAPLATRIDLSQVRSRFINRDQVTGWKVPTSGAAVLLPKPDAIRTLLEDAFAFDTPDPTQPRQVLTVEVIPNETHPEWGDLAAERLNYAGFAAFSSRGAAGATGNTHLIDFGIGDPASRDLLREIFGLPSAAVVDAPETASSFPYRLVLGDDFRPCYDPARFRSPDAGGG